jgi:hypothetical protein
MFFSLFLIKKDPYLPNAVNSTRFLFRNKPLFPIFALLLSKTLRHENLCDWWSQCRHHRHELQ